MAQKLHTETYGFYVAAGMEPEIDLPWLGLSGSLGGIPEQRHAERAFAHRPPRLLVEDVESLGLAVQAGLGVAVLPRSLVGRLGGVKEVAAEEVGAAAAGPLPHRDLWLVVHPSRRELPKVRAVMHWIQLSLVPSGRAEVDMPML